ncbi:hypothetical protein T484DRAFT_1629125, partial [Baffinella frigidus]
MVIAGRRLGCVAGNSLGSDLWCVPCGAGTYRGGNGGEACEGCPVGSTSNTGSTILNDCFCVPGYFGPQGTGACSACPWGTNSSLASTGVGDCSCIAGHTAESDGVACAACEAGKYKSVTGAGACSSCPAGT